MKGIIFNIAESFLEDHYGDDTLDKILERCQFKTQTPFVGPGTYPDEDFLELLTHSSAVLEIEINELLRLLGKYSFSKLAERHPNFLEGYKHPKDFLKTVDGIIHVEVRKLYQDSKLPAFLYTEPSESELVITYHSERKLYSFMKGLIEGTSDFFRVEIQQKSKIYNKEGKEFCDFHLSFSK